MSLPMGRSSHASRPAPWSVALVAVLLLGFALRVFAGFFAGVDPYTIDSSYYVRQARGILSEAPISSFPNGYPLFIALFLALLPGPGVDAGLIAANVALGTATLWLTYRIGLRLTGSPAFGCLAALGLALWPQQLYYTPLIMTEVPCTFLLTLATLLLLEARARWTRAPGDEVAPSLVFLSGLTYHLAAAFRPSVVLVLPLLLLVGWRTRQPARLLATLAAGFLLSLLLFAGLDRLGITRAPSALANNALIAVHSDSRRIAWKVFPKAEQDRALETYARFAATRPGAFLGQRAIALWETWGFWPLPDTRVGTDRVGARLVSLLRFALLVPALIAVWRYRRHVDLWILCVPLIAVTLVHVGTFGNQRFITPVVPMLLILAGRGVQTLLPRRGD